MSKFRHVEQPILRYFLESDPKHLKAQDIHDAFSWSLPHLARDVIDLGVPRQFVESRAECLRRAEKDIKAGRPRKAHSFIRQFWEL